MEIVNPYNVRLGRGDQVILSIPICEDARARSAETFFANDSYIRAAYKGIINETNYDKLVPFGKSASRVVVDIIAAVSTDVVRKVEEKTGVPVYMVPPPSAKLEVLEANTLFQGVKVLNTNTCNLISLIMCITGCFGETAPDEVLAAASEKLTEYVRDVTESDTSIWDEDSVYTLDNMGRVIMRSTKPLIKDWDTLRHISETIGCSMREGAHLACCNTNFVLLSKTDAGAISDLLDEYADQYDGSPARAFGDSVGSYDRLQEQLHGLVHPAVVYEEPPKQEPIIDEDPEADGYHLSGFEEPLVLESPELDEDEEYTPEEWATICKIFGLPADTATRIVLHASLMEYFIDKDDKEESK